MRHLLGALLSFLFTFFFCSLFDYWEGEEIVFKDNLPYAIFSAGFYLVLVGIGNIIKEL